MFEVKPTPYGKKIVTTIPIDETHQLTISTMKRYSGLVSTNVQWEVIDGNFISFSYGDFSKCLAENKIRATEKAMILQHTSAIDEFKNSEEFKKLMGGN